MKKYIIIVAGGKGLRMGGEIPKQFLPIKGKPVLMRTLETFSICDEKIYGFTLSHRIANGGETRFHSVKNGLALVEDNALVGVHDGVRPFVSSKVISECYRVAEVSGAAIPVTDVVETLRQVTENGNSQTVPRNCYKLVQTPQVFLSSLLKQAYSQPYTSCFTDDASVVEAWGHRVELVEGNRENVKLTTPFDLKLAEMILS